jgi:hypothetical protein
MAQTELIRRVSLSLSAKNRADKKGQSLFDSALSSASCRRSEPVLKEVKDRSPALPYPPHECPQFITTGQLPLPKGTSLLCRLGDISILR